MQFGGQTAIKLTEALMKMGVPILGTSAENVDAAEDRELFDEILEQCQIPRPKGQTVFTAEEAKKAANELGYPVLVRPSYVLGGQGMQIAINDEDVEQYIGIINRIAQEHPGAYRESRYPFRRQYLCISGTDHQQDCKSYH